MREAHVTGMCYRTMPRYNSYTDYTAADPDISPQITQISVNSPHSSPIIPIVPEFRRFRLAESMNPRRSKCR